VGNVVYKCYCCCVALSGDAAGTLSGAKKILTKVSFAEGLSFHIDSFTNYAALFEFGIAAFLVTRFGRGRASRTIGSVRINTGSAALTDAFAHVRRCKIA